jgi:hypothetical protein
MSKSGADGEVETDELDDSDGADVLGLGEQGTEDESDQETEDYGFDDEDDTPVERREFGAWPMKSIRQVGLDLSERDAAAPEDRSIALFESSTRYDDNVASTDKLFAWAAPNIRYQPLFFEDVALERYGQTKGLVKQPLISAGKFFADRFLLGSRALRDCPSSCDGPLGFCRPGSPSSSLNGGCGCACEDRPQADCQTCR